MRKTFSKIVVGLIKEHPGLTADDYAEMTLGQGLYDSHSRWPIFSLRTTLLKQYREGRMPEVTLRNVDGASRFFPVGQTDNGHAEPTPQVAAYVFLPPEEAEAVNMLVEAGKFETRSRAVMWLVQEGIRARSEELQHTRDVLRQIQELKESLPALRG